MHVTFRAETSTDAARLKNTEISCNRYDKIKSQVMTIQCLIHDSNILIKISIHINIPIRKCLLKCSN